MTELTPVYDPHKSFYGKAHLESTRRGVTLWSYNTPVMVWLDATDTFARASGQPVSLRRSDIVQFGDEPHGGVHAPVHWRPDHHAPRRPRPASRRLPRVGDDMTRRAFIALALATALQIANPDDKEPRP